MESLLFDIVFVVVALLATFAISRCGGVRAGLWCFGIMLSALTALNLFEPLSQLLIRIYVPVRSGLSWQYGRFAFLLGIFTIELLILYRVFKSLLPEDPELPPLTEHVFRWGSSFLGGYTVAALLLVAMHTFPAPPGYNGYFESKPEERAGVIMQFAPDVHLLKVTQIVSEHVFPIGDDGALFPVEIAAIGDETARGWAVFPQRYHLWRIEVQKAREDHEEWKRLEKEILESD